MHLGEYKTGVIVSEESFDANSSVTSVAEDFAKLSNKIKSAPATELWLRIKDLKRMLFSSQINLGMLFLR